jgi:hypothetical protein
MNISEMEKRLARLERSNRRMRVGSGLLVLCVIAAFAIGAIKGDRVLETEDLIIRDKQGNERARMAVDDSGPFLRLSDSKGHPRAILLVQDDRGLFLLPGGDKMQSELLLVNSGEPTVYLKDNQGQARLEMSTKGDTVRMIMTNPDQKESVVIASAKDGPSLSCFDDKSKLRAQVSVFDNVSRVTLLDSKQVQRASMHAADFSAAFAVADESEIRRAALVYLKDQDNPSKEGAVCATFGPYGGSIWTSPTSTSIMNRLNIPTTRPAGTSTNSGAAPAPAPAGAKQP